ncbi:heme-binding protein [Mycobacterium sp. CVI_P3]|uniref:Heme-binding protein n=1 Tax=Mycobacterium pinniadriaticum TaxID=2994102 RepID=A0ABT3SLP6_9MYCO|nr:heme-binding protein [Mycobacterium pinniadriaticum]MCX2934059.1 heme-binding protein [Mycobacterium pinniadriaticum]MCX2940444.1 heme-binding protein [Mycobacterium pinniadriaticum]
MNITCSVRRAAAVSLAAGALLVGVAGPASADPPPNCTSADLAGIMSGVGFSLSGYLFTHPDVNAFFTSLKGLPKEEMRAKVQDYFAANPQVHDEIRAIRQPTTDFRNRCDVSAPPGIGAQP